MIVFYWFSVVQVRVGNKLLNGVPVVTGTTEPSVISANEAFPVFPVPVLIQMPLALMSPDPFLKTGALVCLVPRPLASALCAGPKA